MHDAKPLAPDYDFDGMSANVDGAMTGVSDLILTVL